jgi:hypothetical protein
MPAALGDIGYGTTVEIDSDNTGTAYTKLAECFVTGLPNPQFDDVELSHYESPDRTREYGAGLNDSGEITVEMNWVPGSATDAFIVAALGQKRSVRITVPSATNQTYTFPAVLKGYERNVPVDDRKTATLTLRVAGAVVQANAV